MIKRLYIYQKEMFPFWKGIATAVILFFEIYFFIVIINDVGMFKIGIEEAVGAFTIFAFLLSLRIADDFKDAKTDRLLFPNRPLPSGRVKKKDLIVLLVLVNIISVTLNVIFMNNLIFYGILIGYGVLMSVWFFARAKIQPNLILALITHNPIGVIINAYIISFSCLKYDLPLWTLNNLLLALTLYWPTLVWEISRKIRAPKDETDYVTYSKLYGYKKITLVVLGIITIDLITSAVLMYELWAWGIFAVAAAYVWFAVQCIRFYKNPEKFKMIKQVEIYELITEVPVVAIEMFYIIFRWLL